MRCKACNVEIITPAAVCPLCGGPLDGTGEKLTPAYPEFVEKRKHYYILRRILLFFSIAAALVSLTANLLFTPHIWWFVFVFTGLLYVWAAISAARFSCRLPALRCFWSCWIGKRDGAAGRLALRCRLSSLREYSVLWW